MLKKKNKKKDIFVLNKVLGQTPLELLNDFKKKNPLYKESSLAYAGRLDPMATGKILVLADEKCKNREKYLSLDKEYVFEILLGFKSDTGDILGLVERQQENFPFGEKSFLQKDFYFGKNAFYQKVKVFLRSFVGKREMKYPAFSSKTVEGKPLFLHSLEGSIKDIEIPEKKINIYALKLLEHRKFSASILQKMIKDKISLIKENNDPKKALGKNFRKTEVLESWEKAFEGIPKDKEFSILKIKCRCSSGTYIRVLSEEIAKALDFYGLAFSIKRTKIGRHLASFLPFWNIGKDFE